MFNSGGRLLKTISKVQKFTQELKQGIEEELLHKKELEQELEEVEGTIKVGTKMLVSLETLQK